MRAAGGFSNYHAYVYADGVVTNLNSLIPAGSGLHLAYASGINHAGQIVGTAFGHRHIRSRRDVSDDCRNDQRRSRRRAEIGIGGVSRNEGNSGTTNFTFTVSVSTASDTAVTVNDATANGYATSFDDHVAASVSLTFAAGQTSKTLSIAVRGDKKREFEKRST